LNAPLDNRTFEVRPVREQSSRISPVGDVLRLSSKDAVDLHNGPGVLVNGVHPVRKISARMFMDSDFMHLAFMHVNCRPQELEIFSNGVQGYV